MHGEIDLVVEQCEIELFGEQALAAGLGERAVLDGVAGRADHADGDRLLGDAVCMGELRTHLMRLGERQGRAARADPQSWKAHATSFVFAGARQHPA